MEDDETIVQIVKRHLQSWGYEVFQVEDFAHVIQEFVQKDPQLVLLDLKLPFTTAFTGARRSGRFPRFRFCSCPQRQTT